MFGKVVIFLALAYVVIPMDLIPDVPVIGWLDDLGVMGVATFWLARVVARYRTPEGLSQGCCSRAPARRRVSVSP